MKNLTTFRINTITTFGIGLINKKANSIEDCFNRLCKSDKNRATSIECLETEEIRHIENGILLESGIISLQF